MAPERKDNCQQSTVGPQRMLKLLLNLKWALCHGFPFSIFHALYQQIKYRSADWDVGFVFRAV